MRYKPHLIVAAAGNVLAGWTAVEILFGSVLREAPARRLPRPHYCGALPAVRGDATPLGTSRVRESI